jgi:hypothetical protein
VRLAALCPGKRRAAQKEGGPLKKTAEMPLKMAGKSKDSVSSWLPRLIGSQEFGSAYVRQRDSNACFLCQEAKNAVPKNQRIKINEALKKNCSFFLNSKKTRLACRLGMLSPT